MPYTVTYTQQIVADLDPGCPSNTSRLRIVITGVTGFTDLGVLVNIVNPITSAQRFNRVASPTDLVDYNYLVIGSNRFVRVATADLWFTTAALAAEAGIAIKQAITDLCLDMDALQLFSPPVVITVP